MTAMKLLHMVAMVTALRICPLFAGNTDAAPAPTTRPTGLEFHIVADDLSANPAELNLSRENFTTRGPDIDAQSPSAIQWFQVSDSRTLDHSGLRGETLTREGKNYLPLLVTPDASMIHSASQTWGLKDISSYEDREKRREISFTFDDAGKQFFAELTTRWWKIAKSKQDRFEYYHAHLAILVNHKVVSAPNLSSPITGGSGVIVGGGTDGFSADEQAALIHAMKANDSSADSETSTTEPSTKQ